MFGLITFINTAVEKTPNKTLIFNHRGNSTKIGVCLQDLSNKPPIVAGKKSIIIPILIRLFESLSELNLSRAEKKIKSMINTRIEYITVNIVAIKTITHIHASKEFIKNCSKIASFE